MILSQIEGVLLSSHHRKISQPKGRGRGDDRGSYSEPSFNDSRYGLLILSRTTTTKSLNVQAHQVVLIERLSLDTGGF